MTVRELINRLLEFNTDANINIISKNGQIIDIISFGWNFSEDMDEDLKSSKLNTSQVFIIIDYKNM